MHKSVSFTPHIVLICALQFADILRLCLSPRTTSRTISFSISNSFWYKFDSFFRYLLITYCTRVVRVCPPLYFGRCAIATVAVCGFGRWFWCFTAGCHVKSSLFPGSPNPLSNRHVLHDWRKHTRLSTFHNPMLSANKHVVQLCRSSQSAAVQTVQVKRRTSPFNGIERSLSRAVVIKTKSLPISATTFPTALSSYIADDGRKHYISTIHHSPRKSMSYKFAAPRYRLPSMALQTVQVSVEPCLSTATHKAEMALNDRSVVS